jgi:hypothetical protein
MVSRLVARDEIRYKQKSVASNSHNPKHKSWIEFSPLYHTLTQKLTQQTDHASTNKILKNYQN